MRAPYPTKAESQTEHRGRLEWDSGELDLSAAVSFCCTVRKSSVMAYLMVIVWSGESTASCLHAGISGVCCREDSAYSRGVKRVGVEGSAVVVAFIAL